MPSTNGKVSQGQTWFTASLSTPECVADKAILRRAARHATTIRGLAAAKNKPWLVNWGSNIPPMNGPAMDPIFAMPIAQPTPFARIAVG